MNCPTTNGASISLLERLWDHCGRGSRKTIGTRLKRIGENSAFWQGLGVAYADLVQTTTAAHEVKTAQRQASQHFGMEYEWGAYESLLLIEETLPLGGFWKRENQVYYYYFFKIGFLVNRQCSSGWHRICEYLDRANLILESLKCSKIENMKLEAKWQI